MGSNALGPTDALPGNLSEQQLFVLALLAIQADKDMADDEDEDERLWGIAPSVPGDDRPGHYHYSRLSWRVAEEFDSEETRRIEDRERSGTRTRGYRRRVLTPMHSKSLSECVRRLEERGYLDRMPVRQLRFRDEQTGYVAPTERGIRAGREAIRRHRDGRFNLFFETIEIDVGDEDAD